MKRLLGPLALVILLWSLSVSGQISVVTQHYDNARTGENTSETVLTHANVNTTNFGKLFTYDLDGQEAAQPLYVPNVFIPGANSTHNVVYAVTQHDSVYAFDGDDDQGANSNPLWQVNFLDPANGVTSVPVSDMNCTITGYTEFGIQGTPVIDLTRNAIYVLAVTKENGIYVHRLHALDLGTGTELFGGPVTIKASVVVGGKTYTFVDKFQQQRPGLLLQGGIVYIAFGDPGCKSKTEMGWVLAYDGGTLGQVGAFDDSPGAGASGIWMSGAGLAGDGAGNVYFSTADGLFDADTGGNHYGDSVLKLNESNSTLSLTDYFTPYNQQYLDTNNLDFSSGQVLLLPDQGSGPLMLAVDKDGTIYLLNQDNLGHYDPQGDFQIPQEISAPVGGHVHAGLTYWNGFIYLLAEKTPAMAYSIANGQLSSQPVSEATNTTPNPRGGVVSANGVQDGILWFTTSTTHKLFAYDATNLSAQLYNSGMIRARDAISGMVHFGMPVVANGHVYVNALTQLIVFGLLPKMAPLSGNNQTGTVNGTLAYPLKVGLKDSYTGQVIRKSGVPVTFTTSRKAGKFSIASTTTNTSGTASTYYTLPARPGTYMITASSPGYVSTTFTVIATP